MRERERARPDPTGMASMIVYLMRRNVLNPVGPQLVHDHGAALGPNSDPTGRKAVRYLKHVLILYL